MSGKQWLIGHLPKAAHYFLMKILQNKNTCTERAYTCFRAISLRTVEIKHTLNVLGQS